MAIKQRAVHHLVPVGLGLSAQQYAQAVPPLTVERGEKEDEHAEQHSAQKKFFVRMVFLLRVNAFAPRHATHEIQADETAENAKEDSARHTLHAPYVVELEREHGGVAGEYVAHHVGCDGGDEYRHYRRHVHVYHQHLKGEHQSRYWRLVDGGDSGGGATAHEHHQLPVAHVEKPTKVGAYGGAREHDRSLGTNRSAETDGQRRCHERRPAVVGLQLRLLGGNGV